MSHRIALLAGASLVALASAALAQDTITPLDPVTLTGSGDATAPVDGYTAPTAASGKTSTPLAETPRSVSVITLDLIEDTGARTLGQALATTAGVVGEPYGADPRFDSPVLRGFDTRNAQYLDSLRIMRSAGAPAFEIYGLERVEVLKGPASTLYGSGSPAGIINMIQKRAQAENSAETGIALSDDGDAKLTFDVNRAVSETLAFRLTGVAGKSEEQIEEITNDRGYLGFATRWQATDATEVQIITSYQADSPITPAGLPYDLTGQGNDKTLRELYIGDSAVDDSDRRMLNLGYEVAHDFGNGWVLSQSARYQKFDWDYAGFYVAGGSAGNTVNRGVIFQDEDTSTVNVDTRMTGSFTTGSASHKLMFGLDLRRYEDLTSTDFATATALDITDPSTIGATVGAPWYLLDKDLTLEQAGIYVQDEITAGAWRATLGLRRDWASQEGTSTNNFGGTTVVDQQDQATTGQAGLAYVMQNGLTPYVSYATSFDPELGVDIDGDQLNPTEGKQWELGMKYQPTAFDGFFSVALYDLRQENVSVTVTEGGITGTRQIGEVVSKGLELEGAAQLGAGWGVKAAFSLNDAEQKGANDGKRPANTPRTAGSLWLTYDFATGSAIEGLQLAGGLRHIGQRYGDNANTYDLDAVTLLDLGASYTLANGAEASLNIANLTDEVYVANCGSFGCYYGDGRTVTAKLNYTW